MTEEQIALAKRAVACKGWRWMPGMLIHAAGTEYRVPDRDHDPGAEDWWRKYTHPDLTDPATLGCLLALVREAWEPYGTTSVSTHRYDVGEWSIRTLPLPMFPTEAEALVAALEAAP
jgi:hypothetical protein